MYGPDWSDYLRKTLMNNLNNVLAKEAPGGYTLYYVGEVEFLKKVHAQSNNERIRAILNKLQLDPTNIKRAPGGTQSSFNRYINAKLSRLIYWVL